MIGNGGMAISIYVCSRCRLSTTKLFGWETGILRCRLCGCVIRLKAIIGSCPIFSNFEDYSLVNSSDSQVH